MFTDVTALNLSIFLYWCSNTNDLLIKLLLLSDFYTCLNLISISKWNIFIIFWVSVDSRTVLSACFSDSEWCYSVRHVRDRLLTKSLVLFCNTQRSEVRDLVHCCTMCTFLGQSEFLWSRTTSAAVTASPLLPYTTINHEILSMKTWETWKGKAGFDSGMIFSYTILKQN